MVHSNFFLKIKNTITLLIVVSFLFLSANRISAQGICVDCGNNIPCTEPACRDCPVCQNWVGGQKGLGTFKGLGALSTFINTLTKDNPAPAATAFSNFISTAIGIMTVVAFIWFILVLFIGAVAWLSSGGDKVKLQEAQKKISTAVTGLIIVISAIFLIKIVGVVFGFDILDITGFITNL